MSNYDEVTKPVICIGASLIDELFHLSEKLIPATTNDAQVTKTAGGVARNIANQLALLEVPIELISVFGEDSDGDWLKFICAQAGVGISGSITKKGLSGKYTGIISDDGALFTAFLTNAANHLITPEHLASQKDLLVNASFILADANISVESIDWLLAFSLETKIPFIIEPVSVPPARKLYNRNLKGLYLITPNEDELPAMCQSSASTIDEQIKELLDRGVHKIWLHRGDQGSTLYTKSGSMHLPAPNIEVVDCTGAGDGSVTGYLLGKYLMKNDHDCLRMAHTLSAEILKVQGAIAKDLTQEKIQNLIPIYYPS
jgi:pseudouridine kinase